MKSIIRVFAPIVLIGCATELTVPTRVQSPPAELISDAVHASGTPGFYFLPPMVNAPPVSGAFDSDRAGLDPRVAICDVTAGPVSDCGGATPAIVTFTSVSSPAIIVDVANEHYKVNWNTRSDAFTEGHTYRLHVSAGVAGARRELGFADVLLTSTPGRVKNVANGDVIVLNDGQTLPVKFRVETGIPGAIAISVAPGTVRSGAVATATAQVTDLRGAPRAGANVSFASSGVPVTFLAASVSSDASGGAETSVTAGTLAGSATITASAGGLSASAGLVVVPAVVDAWTLGPIGMTPRRGFGGMIDGKLYVAGGFNDFGVMYGLLEAYDVASGLWETKAPMPTPRSDAAAAVLNGKLYVVGGWDGTPTSLAALESYDPTTNAWTTLAPLPRPRGYPAASAIDGKLYVFGGLTGPSQFDVVGDVDIYDPATNSWTAGAPMITPRYVASAATLDNRIYVVGGYTVPHGYSEGLATVEAYDPVSNSWSSKPYMNYRRGQTPGAAVVDGKLYVAGGFCVYCFRFYPDNNGPQAWLQVVEAYDPVSEIWSEKASMPFGRFGQTAGAWAGKLYLAGGDRGNLNAGDLLIYEP